MDEAFALVATGFGYVGLSAAHAAWEVLQERMALPASRVSRRYISTLAAASTRPRNATEIDVEMDVSTASASTPDASTAARADAFAT